MDLSQCPAFGSRQMFRRLVTARRCIILIIHITCVIDQGLRIASRKDRGGPIIHSLDYTTLGYHYGLQPMSFTRACSTVYEFMTIY